MKTIRERYESDNTFRMMVDYMVNVIDTNRYTPSEMREAALLASIIYDSMHVRSYKFETGEVETHLRELEKIINTKE